MSYRFWERKDDKPSSRDRNSRSDQRKHEESAMDVDDRGPMSSQKTQNYGKPSNAHKGHHGYSKSSQRYQQHHDPYGAHMSHHGYQDHSGQQGYQMMAQEQAFRSKQASKQMVYEVFANVISILEEFEKREMANSMDKPTKAMPKSKIEIPDQSYKKDHDIQRIVETQLLIFNTHLHSACRPEVRDEVIGEMTEALKRWVAARKDSALRHGKTDEFAAQLYEILTQGKTRHPSVFTEQPDIGEKDLQEAAHHYFEGDMKRAQLDRSFANDPSKKATMPDIRAGSSSDTGFDRIAEHRPDLAHNPNSIL